MSRFVTITEQDGEPPKTHASGTGCPSDWESMCGIDGHDEGLGQTVIPTPRGQKINCVQCQQIILAAKKFSRRDFV